MSLNIDIEVIAKTFLPIALVVGFLLFVFGSGVNDNTARGVGVLLMLLAVLIYWDKRRH